MDRRGDMPSTNGLKQYFTTWTLCWNRRFLCLSYMRYMTACYGVLFIKDELKEVKAAKNWN